MRCDFVKIQFKLYQLASADSHIKEPTRGKDPIKELENNLWWQISTVFGTCAAIKEIKS